MEEEVTHVDADEDVRLMMARLTPDSLGLEATTDVTVEEEREMLQERMSLAPDSLVLRTCLVVATTVAAIVEVIIHKITILRITILKTTILRITILKITILRTIIPHLQDSPSRGVSVTTISPSETGMETSTERAGELTTLAEPGATLMEDVLMVNHPQDSLTIPGHIKPVITMENKKYLILFQNSVDFVMLTCYSFLCLMNL